MTMTTETERRHAMQQALANTRIEGHEPETPFLVDAEAVVRGTMTHEEARARSLERAQLRESASGPAHADAA